MLEPRFQHQRWTDTQGVRNTKYTYFVPFWNAIEAHVEAVEEGRHYITIPDQSAQGCTVGAILLEDTLVAVGPNNTVAVDIDFNGCDKVVSRWAKVACRP
jgi:hypothetical protein